MVTEIRIYFEGDNALKPGFNVFLGEIKEKARARRCRLSLIATNGTPAEDYQIAVESHPNAWNVLLRDSEGPITTVLPEFCAQKNLAGHADNVFWMVQVMESWFFADPDALGRYYGDVFQKNALKRNPQIEHIPKDDILSSLKAASKKTKKGEYQKTAHPPRLLASIDPELVKAAAPNCRRLFDRLLAKLSEG